MVTLMYLHIPWETCNNNLFSKLCTQAKMFKNVRKLKIFFCNSIWWILILGVGIWKNYSKAITTSDPSNKMLFFLIFCEIVRHKKEIFYLFEGQDWSRQAEVYVKPPNYAYLFFAMEMLFFYLSRKSYKYILALSLLQVIVNDIYVMFNTILYIIFFSCCVYA